MTSIKEALEIVRCMIQGDQIEAAIVDTDTMASLGDVVRAALAQLDSADAKERIGGRDEPVAWRGRLITDGQSEPADWSYYNSKPSAHRRYEIEPLYTRSASPPDVEAIARTICRSGKFETGQGTCAVICMDQLGDVRKSGCGHCMRVHSQLATAVAALVEKGRGA